jgi:hypothetical protein
MNRQAAPHRVVLSTIAKQRSRLDPPRYGALPLVSCNRGDRGGDGASTAPGTCDREVCLLLSLGAHPRRCSDGLGPLGHRLLWPKGIRSKLWFMWLIFEPIVNVSSSSTSHGP